ncbi:FAD dependent oxidoreductase family domain protein [Mycobacterium xenopi 3993]|nr:FAD dependent oxidoreductase family domain protein [Mycobacterium xenopi 3993]
MVYISPALGSTPAVAFRVFRASMPLRQCLRTSVAVGVGSSMG